MANSDIEQWQVQMKIAGFFQYPQTKVINFTCHERVNECYTIDCTITTTQKLSQLKTAIQKPIKFEFSAGQKQKIIRHFYGYIGDIEHMLNTTVHKTSTYRLKIYPALWWAGLNSRYRIFEKKSVIDIVNSVCREYKTINVMNKSNKLGREPREYITQYGESDLNFINRLLEEAGINYTFLQHDNNSTMFLFDNNNSCDTIKSQSGMKFPLDKGSKVFNTLFSLRERIKACPGNDGARSIDYNYETPRKNIYYDNVRSNMTLSRMDSFADFSTGALETQTNKQYNVIKAQSYIQEQHVYKGQSSIVEMFAGCIFNLNTTPAKYIVTNVTHKIINEVNEDEEHTLIYDNSFCAHDARDVMAPIAKTQMPYINHTQTAQVIGAKGSDVYTDKLGRVKVLFAWNNPQEKNINDASCWVRVSQALAGNNFGVLFIPRVGQEVIISFINGNPNRPLIIGCVYNNANLPPYLSKSSNYSTIKTVTIGDKKATPGYNELRFCDGNNQEEIFIHAQKDMNQEIENNKIIQVNDGDMTLKLMGKKTGHYKQILHTGSKTVQLLSKKGASNYNTQVNKGDISNKINIGDYSTTIGSGNYSVTLGNGKQSITINGAQDVKIAQSKTVKVLANMDIAVAGNVNMTVAGSINAKSANMSFAAGRIDFKAASEISIQAPMVRTVAANFDLSGASCNIKSAAVFNVNTPSAIINAAANCDITSALTSIRGMVKLGS